MSISSSGMVRILVVDDESQIRVMLQRVLSDDETEVQTTGSGKDCLNLLANTPFDLVLLDLNMQDMDGFEVLSEIRKVPTLLEMPVIMLTGSSLSEDQVKAYSLDITDYIVKPISLIELKSRVTARLRARQKIEKIVTENLVEKARSKEAYNRFSALAENSFDLIAETDDTGLYVFISPNSEQILGYTAEEMLGQSLFESIPKKERSKVFKKFKESILSLDSCRLSYQIQPKAGLLRWFESTFKPFHTADDRLHCVIVSRDVTEERNNLEKLSYLASHDMVTGLLNRTYFVPEVEKAIANLGPKCCCALIYIDLDNFKLLNDIMGHAAGDRILADLGSRLSEDLPDGSKLARLGGDEFVALLQGDSQSSLTAVAEKMHEGIGSIAVGEKGRVQRLKASFGMAFLSPDLTSEAALARADLACYTAKRNGRNRLEIYQEEKNDLEGLIGESAWAARIPDAIASGHFELWFQPIIDLKSGQVNHHEALIRLRDENGKVIMPGAFIPAAERFNLIQSIDRCVMELSIHALKKHPELRISLNLSTHSLNDPDLPLFVQNLFAAGEIAFDRVAFEVTETSIISNLRRAKKIIGTLRGVGFRFALDDFGCGFSSIAYLRELDFDYVKIDGSFIKNLPSEPLSQALVGAMNEIAHLLSKKTVAEFVENEETVRLLESIGVDFAQGYFFGRPGSLEEKPALVLEQLK